MQAISGSVGLSLAPTEASSTSDLTSELGADMASGLGFLALFTTQVSSATADFNLLKGKLAGTGLDGKLFPQGLPQRPLFSEFLSADGAKQLMDNKLFSNLGSEGQNLLDAIQGKGEEDSFAQSLMKEIGSSSLRGKGAQVGTGFAAITNQLGSQSWGDELVSRVKWQIGQDIQEAKISLNPRELGPLQVKISIIDDQAHVQFVAQHGSVRDAIEEAIPRLREMLEQSGMMLADADVSQHSADHQGFFETSETTKDQFSGSDLDVDVEEEGSDLQVKVMRAGVGLVDAFI